MLFQFIESQAATNPDREAIAFKEFSCKYGELAKHVETFSAALLGCGLTANERVAIYLPKQPETVFSIFGTTHAGGVFVPINPLLKPKQVAYILKDCNVRVLITSNQRLKMLAEVLSDCHDLKKVVVIEEQPPESSTFTGADILGWQEFTSCHTSGNNSRIDADMAAILYTSGSTGNPKGVVLSHRNMVAGAKSVASYLENSSDDRLLAVLPFSFDYGLSQLTTAFLVGASVTLMDYLLPADILRVVAQQRITGLAAVPPIWNQLVNLNWPDEAAQTLRYITNSGGAMPRATTDKLRSLLPDTDIYLMYGLTEAFRSTYLPPEQVSVRPDSIGKAIPNAEILVVREDGSECSPGEPGELVHRGALVAMGYWNDPTKTAERFKPSPIQPKEIPLTEQAVWSGDQVKKDSEGYLYFISRKDEMIKTSGYRVSPTEVEEVIYGLENIHEVAAVGLPHPALGQAILLVVIANDKIDTKAILKFCTRELPSFMVPQGIIFKDVMPKNPNGKIDRKELATELADYFMENTEKH